MVSRPLSWPMSHKENKHKHNKMKINPMPYQINIVKETGKSSLKILKWDPSLDKEPLEKYTR